MLKLTTRICGRSPFQLGLLHGGPGAAGEMRPVSENLSKDFGVLEFLQTEKSVDGQIEELHCQILQNADLPITLIGHSWGAWLGFLFAARYPGLLKKLILVSAGAFSNEYNRDLMQIRLSRLNQSDRLEAEHLISVIKSGELDRDLFQKFGRLMSMADSYDCLESGSESVEFDVEIFQSVWAEASKLRDTNELLNHANSIRIPVVAIHGDYDPHHCEGVEKPLSERLSDFRMIKLKYCGHTPWKERFAKDQFYEILRKELG